MSYAALIAFLFQGNTPLPTIEFSHKPGPVVIFGEPTIAEVPDGPMCSPPSPIVMIDVDPPTHLGVLLLDAPTREESIEVSTQIERCSRSVTRTADPWLVLALLRLEQDLGVPASARGVLGAAWCWEAAMRPDPRPGDAGASHGAYQMQSWFWASCGLPQVEHVTTNVVVAATCYWSRAQKYLDDGKCPGNAIRAEAMSANGPKYASQGCRARSLHADELRRWRTPKRLPPQQADAAPHRSEP